MYEGFVYCTVTIVVIRPGAVDAVKMAGAKVGEQAEAGHTRYGKHMTSVRY